MKLVEGKNINLYKEVHSDDLSWGTTSVALFMEVSYVIDYLKPQSILDYGCGKGTLINAIKRKYPDIDVYGYDPAIPGKDVLPQIDRVDLVINTDVLEHIPVDELEDALINIRGLSNNVFFNFYHALADTVLPDGTNAHCTVKSKYWYHNLLLKYFQHVTVLPGQDPWTTIMLTFPIHASLWEKFDIRCRNKIFINDIRRLINPIYKYMRPICAPVVRYILKKIT